MRIQILVIALIALITICAPETASAQIPNPAPTCAELTADIATAKDGLTYWTAQVTAREARLAELQAQYAAAVFQIIWQGTPPSPGQIQTMNMLTDAMSTQRIAISSARNSAAYWQGRLAQLQSWYAQLGC